MWTHILVMFVAVIVLSVVAIYLSDRPSRNHLGVLITIVALAFIGSYGFNVLASA